jgi:protein-disulfide isomerase
MTAKTKGPGHARAVAAKKLAQQRAAERRRKSLIAGGIAAVVVVAAMIIAIIVFNSQKPKDTAIPKGGSATGITLGKSTAKAHIDLYVDYICPFCKQFETEAGATLDKWVADGTARVTYHPIAFLDGNSTTKYSTRASAAAACAADDGKFAEFTKAAFARQPAEGSAGLSDDQLIQLGKSAGAGSSFATCVTDGKYLGWVSSVTDAGSKAGVNSTPTIKVNGKQLSQPTLANLTKAVEAATK